MTSLSNFIEMSDSLIEFNAEILGESLASSSVYSLEVHRDELREIWLRFKPSYEISLKELNKPQDEATKLQIETLKARYQSTYQTYVSSMARLSEEIETRRANSLLSSSNVVHTPNRGDQYGLHIPPCDTEKFHGDYLSWPSFRDLFTAIYINNPRLSPVEKLFHLNHKTRDEAREVVRKAPLTNEGFNIAWEALKLRYDNKRLLINSQLKVLFGLQKISSETGSSIKSIQSAINGVMSALKLYLVDIKSWDPIFVYICCSRLPENTLSLWEQSFKNKTDCPSWVELDNFLTSRYQTLETVLDFSEPSIQTKIHDNSKTTSKVQIPKRVNSYQNSLAPPNCKLCPDQSHTIRLCPKFKSMNYKDRLFNIQQLKLCLNCFAKGHIVKDCKSSYNCLKCHKRHNTLLHYDKQDEQTPNSSIPLSFHIQSTSDSENNTSNTTTIQTCVATTTRKVLLGTGLILIVHHGTTYKARALFDSGSEASFISDRIFNLLKLKSSCVSTQISGLNGQVSATSRKICNLNICSPLDPNISIEASAIVIPKLTSSLPTFTIRKENFDSLPNIQLADPFFYQSSGIDLLIGADLFPTVMLNGIINNVCGSLIAHETIFGWILTGPIQSDPISSFASKVCFFNEVTLDKDIAKFWEIEDVPRKKYMSENDKRCEDIYKTTTTRDSQGRFIVSLPFDKSFNRTKSLGISKKIAMAQFLRNEKRLLQKPDLKKQYDEDLKEYLTLGHMKEVTSSAADETGSYYLPHHAVVRPDSVTTKVRVVFNASSPTSNGVSLNDVLLCGPTLQQDLTLLLLQWRFYKIVFNSDITKMYRQIFVNPRHTPFQKILHRSSLDEEIKEYELQTVTFGVNCAPFLALRTIQQLAKDVENTHPIASKIMSSCMYVDDILAGCYDVPSAIRAQDELINALGSAGFILRKWTSNNPACLKNIDKTHLLHEEFLQFEEYSTAKTLGVRWNAKTDQFYFSFSKIEYNSATTKRKVLSEISKLFDPIGWLSPFIVLAKLLMRDIWSTRVNWDVPLPPQILNDWKAFLKNYPDIAQIKISRWCGYYPECEVQIHGFCDSSEKAYAAVVYVRIEMPTGEIKSQLILAKSRVSPLKTLSIPRLELCGALLLAEAMESVTSSFPFSNYKVYCWTDSMIVLAWLKKPAFHWKTFVANRVSKISELVTPENWSHVESKNNPADIASRGAMPNDLVSNQLWWCGPPWLILPPSIWPLTKLTVIDENDLEPKTIHANFTYFHEYSDILERFSSLGRALRVLAHVFRFINKTRRTLYVSQIPDPKNITKFEIMFVRNRLITISQKYHYPNEYNKLFKKELIPTSSSISCLNPFIDEKGVMRVCSRIAGASSLTYDEQYPIILPYNGYFTRLLLKFIHDITLHGGNNLMLRMVRLQFWIPKAKNLIKTCIHQCKMCVISKHKIQTQLMAALPPERITFTRPFVNTGIDFAGPFEIKNYSGRRCVITKGYVCVLVCFSTKAIHLELTTSLSTQAFLASFHRFISRRGCPSNIYSDNGKTFVGASKEISKNFLACSREAILSQFIHHNISWEFIPPGAPHMGGLWEAGVKSFKIHFRKMAGTHKFTFEEFSTILSRIEACLNSRPISPMSESPDDLIALTPGHFLIGGPILSIAEPIESENNLSLLNRWRRVSALAQQFSIRWKHEYLKELHKRFKWKTPKPNIDIGAMVVVRDDCLPPTEWRLGRISKIFYGKDNLARVVNIKTQKGEITRPIVKVVLLPNC